MIPQNLLTDVPIYAQNAQEINEPTNQDTGHEVGQTLPAAWWNWLWQRQTRQHNNTKAVTDSIIAEINNVLQNQQIEPSVGANNQLVEAIYKITQQALEEPTEDIGLLHEALTALEERFVPATHDKDGIMSYQDKIKLDGIDEGANKYELPIASPAALGGIKIGENLEIDEDGTLNAQAGGGGTVFDTLPIGTIITGLAHETDQWLFVDGRILEINDYTTLAHHFELIFGSMNHFGGDGVLTFALPDLRKLLIEGAGGNGFALGTITEAGLPNIEGRTVGGWTGSQTVGATGAFSESTRVTGGSSSGAGGNGQTRTSYLNAASSSPVYGKSNTVQPNTFAANYFIKARDAVSDQHWVIGQGLQLINHTLSVATMAPYASETVPGIAMFAPIPED